MKKERQKPRARVNSQARGLPHSPTDHRLPNVALLLGEEAGELTFV